MQLSEVAFLEPAPWEPGKNNQPKAHYTAAQGWEIDYNPQTGLITCAKGATNRSMHVSRTRDLIVAKKSAS